MSQLESARSTQPAARTRAASRWRTEPLELLEAKLRVPRVRTGTVPRPGLVNRLRAARAADVVSIVAPAGFGKTTLLSQWAERDERPFAWVSIDEGDDDLLVLLRYVAAALHRVEPVAPPVFDALAASTRSPWSTALPRLAGALAGVSAPIVLVLDDVHALRSTDSARAIATLARHVAEGSALVLAGRTLPLPVARQRAAGSLLEIGADDLALSRRESQLLLRGAQLELEDVEVADLTERTEGWAAGLHLAGLVLQRTADAPPAAREFTGADRFVADYFHFEHLSRLGRADLRFLTRSSVLDTMSGPLCDAVLGRGRQGSSRRLESLEQASLFVVPLDRRRGWFRYHRLFRETLREELERREPELVPELNRRAAAWCEANGAPEEARRYATAAGDIDMLARLVTAHAVHEDGAGRLETSVDWLDVFGDPAVLERYPAVAALGSWIHALDGRPAEADRWLEVAERTPFEGKLPDGTRSLTAWTALLRAAFCRNGVERMLADAESAVEGLGPGSPWRPTALCLVGVAHLLLGAEDRADAILAEAAESAGSVGGSDARILALAERSLLATAGGDHAVARDLAHEARALAGDGPGTPLAIAVGLAASARAELRCGSWERARANLDEADGLRPRLTRALPWYAVQSLLELARARMALLDTVGARALLREAEAILVQHPELGVLVSLADEVRAQLDDLELNRARQSSMLTAAELRLVPLLTTRLTFREIGERLHISRTTVKTQAIAVYRKLGVSSRNDAIDRAAELGLVVLAADSIVTA